MAGVARRRPADEEARIFHALALIAVGQLHPSDSTYARQREAARILEPLYRRHPDHPGLAHYLIHAYDSPALAREGVAAADRYASIAPSVPHAEHMPSHIYTRDRRVGQVDHGQSPRGRGGAAVRSGQARRGDVGPARACSRLPGVRLPAARTRSPTPGPWRSRWPAVTETFPPSTLTVDYALAAIPARLALERDDWAGRGNAARPPGARLARRGGDHPLCPRARSRARRSRGGRARPRSTRSPELERTLAVAGGAQAYWSTQVRIQRLAASAWVALAAGDTVDALRQGMAAADLDDAVEKASRHAWRGAARPRAVRRPAGPGRPSGRGAGRLHRLALARQPGRARCLAAMGRVGQTVGQR